MKDFGYDAEFPILVMTIKGNKTVELGNEPCVTATIGLKDQG